MATIHALAESRTTASEPAVADHVETYGAFIHLVGWVGAHLLIDAAGIIALIEGHVVLGFFLIACGTTLLVWAVLTARRAGGTARATVAPSAGDLTARD